MLGRGSGSCCGGGARNPAKNSSGQSSGPWSAVHLVVPLHLLSPLGNVHLFLHPFRKPGNASTVRTIVVDFAVERRIRGLPLGSLPPVFG